MKKPAIVIPAFRRARSLRRLLLSILDSLLEDHPEIIISLEGGALPEVCNEAENFKSIYPRTKIISRSKQLGLREHILACGDLSYEHGAVIVLEDDLMVDPKFYSFAKQALSFYSNDEMVAGIALYAPESNDFAGLPFRAMNSGFDTYFMRTPCSWGQAWTAEQWGRFREWYRMVDQHVVQAAPRLPAAIKDWPETSWKKYFAAYMSLKELDFAYPYSSLTTNCAESGGMHVEKGSDLYQVSLSAPRRPLRTYQFMERSETSNVSYDEHMEASGGFIFEWLGLSSSAVTIDLYGIKSLSCLSERELVVTSRKVNVFEHCVEMRFRPIEQNLRFLKGERHDQTGYWAALARPCDIAQGKFRNQAKKLAYFSGFNLDSTSNAIEIARRVPVLLLKTAINRLIRIIGR